MFIRLDVHKDSVDVAVAPLPTLIVCGARDTVIPVAHAEAAHAAIAGSRLEVFPEAGHYPHCDAPARFADTLLGFIASSPAGDVSADLWRAMLRNGPPAAAAEATAATSY